MKKCTKCKTEKDLSEFGRHSQGRNGYNPVCKICNAEQTRLFKRTIPGHITNIYKNQKRNSVERNHIMPNCTRNELLDFALSDSNYNRIHNNWVTSEYDNSLSPSYDRINDYKPYTLNNIGIKTGGEHCAKTGLDKINGFNNKASKSVMAISIISGEKILFYSVSEAARKTPTNRNRIQRCCQGELKSAGNHIWKWV